MSDRVVAIRILGLGDTSSVVPAVFTTRPITGQSTLVAGTVVSLANQLSSEIQVFGTLGSDSTTSFTVLSTPATRRLLLSRGKVEVYDPTLHQPVRLTGYVSPADGVVTIPVSYPAAFTVGNYYRVQNTVFKIVSKSPVLTGSRVWGCKNVPIAMTQQGVGNEPIGAKLYDLNDDNPLGGCEQLPVVITTQETDGSDVEIIFRGYVSKVSNDTSSGQQNLIKVDCSSMMAYIKSAPFIPAWGAVTANATRPEGRIYQTGGNASVIQTLIMTEWVPEVFGTRYDATAPVAGDTIVNLWQVRQESKGGISVPLAIGVNPNQIRVDNAVAFDFDGTFVAAPSNQYPMVFNNGYYDTSGFGPPIDLAIGFYGIYEADVNGTNSRSYSTSTTAQSPTVKGENCIESADFASCIVDLLLGCYNADITLDQGARSANESSWLPFPINNVADIIDQASLINVFSGLERPDVVLILDQLIVNQYSEYRAILPYEHTSAKTVGEVLEQILKRLGAYMVYDKGKFYFGSWAGARQTPIYVTDSALSDPSIKLTFERGLSLMRVTAKYCTSALNDAVTYEVPYLNVDLAASALGKEMSIGHWFSGNHNPDDPYWGQSQLMANAFGLIMRYSQSAARVDLSLRDSLIDLQIGQEIALSSNYIVNSSGEMGVQSLTGYVLKAARSWATPTTAYTIILPGYTQVTNNIPVWSCSGRVDAVPGGDTIRIEENYFTLPAGSIPTGNPTTDAAAFELTHDLNGSWYEVQLLDQYGTFKYQGELGGVSGNYLNLPGFDAYAVPGDIIILADASYFGYISIAAIWDAFQADDSAQVIGSTVNARKWVP